MKFVVPSIQIPLTSEVQDVRPNAQANGRTSLYFFLTAILGTSCSPELAQFLQVPGRGPRTVLFSKHRLKTFAPDFLLWNSIQTGTPRRISVHGITLPTPSIPEPVRWLYGQFPILPPVTWAPDIILTSNSSDVLGPVFDAQRR